jgi:hypothetical protein
LVVFKREAGQPVPRFRLLLMVTFMATVARVAMELGMVLQAELAVMLSMHKRQ